MRLVDFIINDVKPVNINTKIKDLQELFNQLTYTHLPIEDDNHNYLGCVFETDVHCFDGKKKINDYSYTLENFHVRKTTLWLDVLEAFARNSSNIMPV